MAKRSQFDTFFSRGQTRYRCPNCKYDSHLESNVLKHIKDIHKVHGGDMFGLELETGNELRTDRARAPRGDDTLA